MADSAVYRMTEALAGLARMALDAAQGLAKASVIVRSRELARTLDSFAEVRKSHFDELSHIVAELGVDPPEAGSPGGGTHRAWLELTHDVDTHDRPILVECLRAEHHAEHKYRLAAEMILPRQANDAIDQHRADIAHAIETLEGLLTEAIVAHQTELRREEEAFAQVLERREGPRLDNA